MSAEKSTFSGSKAHPEENSALVETQDDSSIELSEIEAEEVSGGMLPVNEGCINAYKC
jgi:hypothetical protein